MAFFSCFLSQSVWATFYIMMANTWFVKGEIAKNDNKNNFWCKNMIARILCYTFQWFLIGIFDVGFIGEISHKT